MTVVQEFGFSMKRDMNAWYSTETHRAIRSGSRSTTSKTSWSAQV